MQKNASKIYAFSICGPARIQCMAVIWFNYFPLILYTKNLIFQKLNIPFTDNGSLPGFLMPVLTQLFLPKPLTTFLTCIGGERWKVAGNKVCRNQVRMIRDGNLTIPLDLNSQKVIFQMSRECCKRQSKVNNS